MTYPVFSNGGEPDWIWRGPRTPNEKYSQFLRNLENLKGSQLYGQKPLNQYQGLVNMGFKPSDIKGAGPNFYKLHSDLDLINARLKHQRMIDPFKQMDIRLKKLFDWENQKVVNASRTQLGYDTQDLRRFINSAADARNKRLQIPTEDWKKWDKTNFRSKPVNPKVAAALKYAAEMDAAIKAGKTIDEIPHAPWHKSNQSRWSRFINSPFMKTVGKVARRLDPFPWMIAPIIHPNQFDHQMPTAMRRGGQIKK